MHLHQKLGSLLPSPTHVGLSSANFYCILHNKPPMILSKRDNVLQWEEVDFHRIEPRMVRWASLQRAYVKEIYTPPSEAFFITASGIVLTADKVRDKETYRFGLELVGVSGHPTVQPDDKSPLLDYISDTWDDYKAAYGDDWKMANLVSLNDGDYIKRAMFRDIGMDQQMSLLLYYGGPADLRRKYHRYFNLATPDSDAPPESVLSVVGDNKDVKIINTHSLTVKHIIVMG